VSTPRSSTYDAHETHRMQEVHGMPLAPFWRRAGAFFLDLGVASAMLMGIAILYVRAMKYAGREVSDIKLEIDFHTWYSIVMAVLYFALWTFLTNGRTPGKWIFGIRIVSLVHERLSLWHSIERALGYGASALEFGFGFLQYFISPNRRTVHDRIAETVVVRHTPAAKSGKD
jgi:uncharacterized RDD family membrane protein YckC